MDLAGRIKYAEMKARHQAMLRPWYKKPWGVTVIIALILVLVVLAVSSLYVASRVQQILAGQTSAMTADQLKQYLQTIKGDGTDYQMGTGTPQVTIVEFGDFACPYSKASYQAVNQVVAEYPGKVKLVWRDYLRNADSIDLAMTARCAGEQGKFWQMHDLLFANQDALSTNDSARPGKLMALAQALNLNTTQFSGCLSGGKYLDQIKNDYNDGNTLQIIGTPTWFVNNYTFAGSLTADKFQELIGGLVK